jgi:hypothetical protein
VLLKTVFLISQSKIGRYAPVSSIVSCPFTRTLPNFQILLSIESNLSTLLYIVSSSAHHLGNHRAYTILYISPPFSRPLSVAPAHAERISAALGSPKVNAPCGHSRAVVPPSAQLCSQVRHDCSGVPCGTISAARARPRGQSRAGKLRPTMICCVVAWLLTKFNTINYLEM